MTCDPGLLLIAKESAEDRALQRWRGAYKKSPKADFQTRSHSQKSLLRRTELNTLEKPSG
jgi:hypothetical protein